MDMSIIVVVWVVIIVIQNIFDKKKPQPPQNNLPPSDSDTNFPGFKIPTLANDPNFPGEENSILVQDTTQPAEVREINLAELYRQKKLVAQTENNFPAPQVHEVQNNLPEVESKKFSLDLTPSATMNAVILGEILSKPKFRK